VGEDWGLKREIRRGEDEEWDAYIEQGSIVLTRLEQKLM